MAEVTQHQLSELFVALGQVLVDAHTTVIDGGTQSGVMALMGEGLARANRSAPYIGVVPARAAVGESGLTAESILEPHHSHFVLVDSNAWGDEVPVAYQVIGALSAQVPSVAMLVNGGSISLQEVEWNVQQQRTVIVVAGSGRLADEIAGAIRDPEAPVRDRVAAVVRKGHFIVFDMSEPVQRLTTIVQQSLTDRAFA
jgi:hypothetical protein